MSSDDSQAPSTDHHPGERLALGLGRAVTYLVFLYLIVVEIILFLGFMLRLLGANPDSSFVRWCYRNLESAMRPFRGIFEPIELGTAGNEVTSVVETSVIFAMIVYGILAIIATAGLDWLRRRVTRLDNDERYEREVALRERELRAQEERVAVERVAVEQATMATPVATPTAVPAATPAPLDPPVTP